MSQGAVHPRCSLALDPCGGIARIVSPAWSTLLSRQPKWHIAELCLTTLRNYPQPSSSSWSPIDDVTVSFALEALNFKLKSFVCWSLNTLAQRSPRQPLEVMVPGDKAKETPKPLTRCLSPAAAKWPVHGEFSLSLSLTPDTSDVSVCLLPIAFRLYVQCGIGWLCESPLSSFLLAH